MIPGKVIKIVQETARGKRSDGAAESVCSGAKSFEMMVRPAGFEPATSCSGGKLSIGYGGQTSLRQRLVNQNEEPQTWR